MSIRASIPLELYAVIDAALKTLKISSRRVTAVEEAFAEEAQVLKRIYYKSKNQHRSALFFKRTQEVRRMSERVSSTRISKPLAAIRDGFHDLTPAEFTKVHKNQAWSKVPSRKLFLAAIHRLHNATQLFSKAETVLARGYQAFELLIQSNTFLPLALTLVAIISRLSAILKDLHSCILELAPVIRNIAQILGCSKDLPKAFRAIETHLLGTDPSSHDGPSVDRMAEDFSIGGPNDDDIGQSISRTALLDDSGDLYTTTSSRDTRSLPLPSAIWDSSSSKPLDDANEPSLLPPLSTTHESDMPTLPTKLLTMDSGSVTMSKQPTAKSKKTKRKKKGDEIDDIFGGL